MSSTSDIPNVTSSRLDEPCPPPPAVENTAETVSSPQYGTGPTLPQRSEAQDIPRKQGRNTFNSERPLDIPRKQESSGFNSEYPQDIPRKQESNALNSESPQDIPRKQESNGFNSEYPQDIPRKQESNAFGSECPQDIPRKQGSNAFNSERPQDVRPAPEGGVALGGQSSLSQGHATMGDKIIGKTEKMIGKITNDRERHERGELREASGKAAAAGGARTASD